MSTIQPESTLTATEIAAGTITASDVATRRPIVSAHLGCLQSFNRLLQLIPNSDLISPDTQLVKRVRDEFERYQLWAGNVGAGHSKYKLSLDYRLEDASFYSEQVLELINILNRHTERALAELGEPVQRDPTRRKDESNEEETSDSDESFFIASSESDSSSESNEADRIVRSFEQLLRSINLTITSLYKIQIRKPAPVDRLHDKPTGDIASFQSFDMMHVRDMFRDLDERVVSTLGKMITRRRQVLEYRTKHRRHLQDRDLPRDFDLKILQQQAGGLEAQFKVPAMEADTVSEQRSATSGLKSEATKLVAAHALQGMSLDLPSTVETASTTSENASAFTFDSPVEVPKRPQDDNGPKINFECKYCCLTVHITSDKAWKHHVLQDMQPHVCTFPGCAWSEQFFETRKSWFEHEMACHRQEFFCNNEKHQSYSQLGSFEAHMLRDHGYAEDQTRMMMDLFSRPSRAQQVDCNLCGRTTAHPRSHISRHLQHLALFAIPRADYDNDHVAVELGSEADSEATSESLDSDQQKRLLSCNVCGETYMSRAILEEHIRVGHSRPFTCVFHHAGCDASFTSKMEWKRHVNSQHIRWTVFHCVQDNCANFSSDQVPRNIGPTTARPGKVFSRRDLYDQHVRRMHTPAKFTGNPVPEWTEKMNIMRQEARKERVKLPERLDCPVPDCKYQFLGETAWDKYMEHIAQHLERAAAGHEPSLRFKPENYDTLFTWAAQPGVDIVRRTSTGWELLKKPKSLNARRSRGRRRYKGPPYLIETSHIQREAIRENVTYAMLSHCWDYEDGEVSSLDMTWGTHKQKQGYAKLESACRLAASHGYKYIWIDTCCLNREDPGEMSEAINAMFDWYKNASVCYVYLADVEAVLSPHNYHTFTDALSRARWFTRGWTLLELVAPDNVQFVNRTWRACGSKIDLASSISSFTNINQEVLLDPTTLSTVPVARRLSWASRRTTTRPEDQAYCLIGLFGIYLPILYGEGLANAFHRLQLETLKVTQDLSLLGWSSAKYDHTSASVIAKSPADFAHASSILFKADSRTDSGRISRHQNGGIDISKAALHRQDDILALNLGCVWAADDVNGDGVHLGLALIKQGYGEGLLSRDIGNNIVKLKAEYPDEYSDICLLSRLNGAP